MLLAGLDVTERIPFQIVTHPGDKIATYRSGSGAFALRPVTFGGAARYFFGRSSPQHHRDVGHFRALRLFRIAS